MTTPSRLRVLIVTTVLVLLTGSAASVQAQGAAARKTPPPAKMDPQARTTLDAMTAAYKALKSYTATVTVESGAGGRTQKGTATLAFQRPGRAKVVMSDETGPSAESLVNGSGLFLASLRDNQYVKRPAPPGDAAIPAVLSEARGALLPTLAGSPEFLSRLFTQPGVTVGLGTPATVADVPTDTVAVSFTPAPGAQIRITLSVSTEDHLLRQLTETVHETRGGQTQTLTHVETVTEQALDPALTAADFAFVPPPGAKLVTTLEPPMFDPRLQPGARPFPITAADLNKRPLSLDQYRGKVVLMDFWATWCGPCVGEMPNVIAAYHKYHAQGFTVLGISLDQDRGALTSFLKHNKMPWRQVFDGKGWGSAVPKQYGVMSIPFGLLLNRDGTIAAVGARGPDLPAAIKVALAKK